MSRTLTEQMYAAMDRAGFIHALGEGQSWSLVELLAREAQDYYRARPTPPSEPLGFDPDDYPLYPASGAIIGPDGIGVAGGNNPPATPPERLQDAPSAWSYSDRLAAKRVRNAAGLPPVSPQDAPEPP